MSLTETEDFSVDSPLKAINQEITQITGLVSQYIINIVNASFFYRKLFS